MKNWVRPSIVFLAALAIVHAQSPNDLLEAGRKAMDAGNFQAAQEDFASLVKIAPTPLNFDFLGTAEANNGNMQQAIAHFEQSIRLGNTSGDVHYRLGLALLNETVRKRAFAN